MKSRRNNHFLLVCNLEKAPKAIFFSKKWNDHNQKSTRGHFKLSIIKTKFSISKKKFTIDKQKLTIGNQKPIAPEIKSIYEKKESDSDEK